MANLIHKPLVDGMRVRLVDGREGIVSSANVRNVVYVHNDEGKQITCTFRDTGCSSHERTCGTCGSPCSTLRNRVAEILSEPVDWSKPLEAEWDGRVFKAVVVSNEPGRYEGNQYAVKVNIPEWEEAGYKTPYGASTGLMYTADGKHCRFPDIMPVIRNVGSVSASPEMRLELPAKKTRRSKKDDGQPRLELPLKEGQYVQCVNGTFGYVKHSYGREENPRTHAGNLVDEKGNIIRENAFWYSNGCGNYSHRNDDGTPGHELSSYDVLYNVNLTPPTRTRVRKPKPTLDQNFKELVSLTAEMKEAAKQTRELIQPGQKLLADIERINWLLRQVVKDLAPGANLAETVADIFAKAQAEADSIVQKAVKKMECEQRDRQEALKAEEYAFLNDKATWLQEFNDKSERLERDFEARVQEKVDERIDQMHGKKATLKRSRPIKLKVKVDE